MQPTHHSEQQDMGVLVHFVGLAESQRTLVDINSIQPVVYAHNYHSNAHANTPAGAIFTIKIS